ncbi:ZIP family zinc transporter [Clostridium tetanomorphum]|uniref:ZIP family metal transporter n=2 Tax=Clostridium tetanomorphum TaxID=1553 RepID=A0A923EDF0_CLOTT|nr:ZIP family metal transporter [Clostridium tetanomorphum]MBC2399391.1 ZIP family metal transporter [Clostridium tetanomorphum]MBP1865697.1 ZIP family zinc transporter [Clostridium tetanomorphum]NRS86817.1 ZIP family zinc transporter [Clostridium tetanomorphum]
MIILGSVVSLSGTTIGGLMGIVIKNPSKRTLGTIIGFSGGLMLSIVVFDLIPEALQNWGFNYTILCCIMGIVLVTFVDNNLQNDKVDRHIKMALITAIGLMIHNFPEGIIMGCGFAAGGSLGLKMSIIIAIHDIPEGIAVSAPLMVSRIKPLKIFGYTVATALPTVLGAFIGTYIGNMSRNALGISLSVASGIMLYVVCGEMIPESSKLWDGVSSTIGVLSGIIFGLILIKLL